MMLKTTLLIALFILKGETKECIPRDFGYGSVVCVCNSTYCDSPPEPRPLKENAYNVFVSTKSGRRMELSTGQFEPVAKHENHIFIDSNQTYQKINGFGCAFTDSSGINLLKLSEKSQHLVMKQYYGESGTRYKLGRIPIGGTDFSTRSYTYDDSTGDMNLHNFHLQPEDYNYKIPFVKIALNYDPEVKLFGSPWSAPTWMKTNNKINGLGFLKFDAYQPYAEYLLRFIDSYAENGIRISAITTGNEPLNGFNPFSTINCMAWTPLQLSHWVAEHLGPTIAHSKYNDTKIMILDDQRILLPWYVELVLRNEDASKYIDGIAVHWYTDDFTSPSVLTETHEAFPSKFLLMTEACTGSKLWDWPKVCLGSWRRAESYILNIIEHLNHWTTGWVDWNCALDKQGGPNWIKNFVDSPIIVNPETDEFFKQPMYYAMSHISRHVPPGSVKIANTETEYVKTLAFKIPSGETVLILYNKDDSPQDVTIHDTNKHGVINYEMPAKSMHTIIYKE